MPPKAKYTKNEIATAALEIIRTEGLAALTARELGKRLRTSVSPIFTVFENMEDVKLSARELALKEFMEYISDYREYTPAFKRIGMMMVSYGINQPELFKLIFMQEHKERISLHEALNDLGGINEICTKLIEKDYSLSHEDAELLFEQMITQAFGLGTMCAMKVCELSEEEIGRRLGLMFAGQIMIIKSDKMQSVFSDVEKNSDGTYHGRPLNNIPFGE